MTVPQEEKMSAISELIRSEADGTISFGDYTLDAKAKLDNFGHQGDLCLLYTSSGIAPEVSRLAVRSGTDRTRLEYRHCK